MQAVTSMEPPSTGGRIARAVAARYLNCPTTARNTSNTSLYAFTGTAVGAGLIPWLGSSWTTVETLYGRRWRRFREVLQRRLRHRVRSDAQGQFQYAFSILYSFQGGTDGEFPYARLRLGRGGTIFGTTLGGGDACHGGQGCGTVFELVPGSSGYIEHILYRFQGNSDGGPTTRLVTGAHNILYGTTSEARRFGLQVRNSLSADSLEKWLYQSRASHRSAATTVPRPMATSSRTRTGTLFGTAMTACGHDNFGRAF